MKKGIIRIWILVIVALTACKDDDINLFDKSADERVAEAIAALKSDLMAPGNGWKLRYRPTPESGSYHILLTFDEDNNVTLRTDLGANNGEFFEQTITYRIDSSLGLELIMESYCFFSYLAEQNQSTFGAEFEFLYRRKESNGDLVFESKTDFSNPTVLVFEEASPSDLTDLLGSAVATNLNEMSDDLENFTPAYKLTFEDRDLVFYVTLADFERTVNIKSAARKNNTGFVAINFTTPYIIEGDALILDQPFAQTILGNQISIEHIEFDAPGDNVLNICPSPITLHTLDGVTSANDDVILESSLADLSGARFSQVTDFFAASIGNIFINGLSQGAQITQDIKGAVALQLYYNFEGDGFYAMGFVIQNTNGSISFALREFTPVLAGNKIVFNFDPDVEIFGEPNTEVNLENVKMYLDALAEGDNTFVFQYSAEIYEFFNPCSQMSIGFEPILED